MITISINLFARSASNVIMPSSQKRRIKMAVLDTSNSFIKEYQERFEKKLKENEITLLEHWKGQLDKIVSVRPDSVASLQMQIKKTTEMMANRIKVLKKEKDG
jgi:hypothetical protein